MVIIARELAVTMLRMGVGHAGVVIGASSLGKGKTVVQIVTVLAVIGGFVGGHLGMRAVFLATTAVIFAGAAYNWVISRRCATDFAEEAANR